MSPLLRRRRAAVDGASDPAATQTGTLGSEDGHRTAAEPEAAQPAAEVPAVAEPAAEDAHGERPDTRRRGRQRRRLRHLRRVRELMLRDVGGLVYEIQRAEREPAGDASARPHQDQLVQGKLDRLVALDAERRRLEDSLGDRRAETILREPGVGGACPRCGEYFASDAHFCSRCGSRVDGRADAADPGEAGAAGNAGTRADAATATDADGKADAATATDADGKADAATATDADAKADAATATDAGSKADTRTKRDAAAPADAVA